MKLNKKHMFLILLFSLMFCCIGLSTFEGLTGSNDTNESNVLSNRIDPNMSKGSSHDPFNTTDQNPVPNTQQASYSDLVQSAHDVSIGGIIVDSGKFDWTKQPNKFPMLNEPDPSYHGIIYSKTFGPAAFISCCRVVPLRETGACLSPNNAYIIMLGLESLGVRMERHCKNALALAQYLESHDRIKWVNYAALPNDKYNHICKKITNGHASGIISFGLKGGKDAGAKFIDALQMILRVLSMGDAKSLACHPASTLHRQLTPKQKALAGVSEDLIRISVGIEHIDDIIQDVKQAIDASQK